MDFHSQHVIALHEVGENIAAEGEEVVGDSIALIRRITRRGSRGDGTVGDDRGGGSHAQAVSFCAVQVKDSAIIHKVRKEE